MPEEFQVVLTPFSVVRETQRFDLPLHIQILIIILVMFHILQEAVS